MTTIASLHAAWERASGTTLKLKVWERGIDSFIKAGFTEADVICVFKYARRENARFTSNIQGFTITPFKVFDFEYRWFDSLLSQARASERNRRPKPTECERTLATYKQVVEPEMGDKRVVGVGVHVSTLFKNNPGNQ